MKIAVDGRVVYLGECKAGAYVYVGEHSQGDKPISVASTENLVKDGVLIDFSEDGEVVGVEILSRSHPLLMKK